MILSTDPKFLFMHIPKTGGSSMEEVLYHFLDFDYSGPTHSTMLNYKHYVDKELFDSLFKFTTIRNPWDLQVSCWRYYVRNSHIDMTFDEYIKWKFEGYIMDMADRIPRDVEGASVEWLQNAFYVHRTPLTYFFIDEEGNFLVDYLLTLERSAQHFENVCKHLGLKDAFLPHSNVSNETGETYHSYYTEYTKNIVSKVFSLDIKLFGYDYDTGFADVEKVGYITDENNSLKKRGIGSNVDIFFNIANLPYGFGNVKRRYDNESEMWERSEFEKDKLRRRIHSIDSNVHHIMVNIERMENEIIQNPDDQFVLTTNSQLINELNERKIAYKIQIEKLRRMVQS